MNILSTKILGIAKLITELVTEVGDLQNIQTLVYNIGDNTFVVPCNGKEYRGKVTFTLTGEDFRELLTLPPVVTLTEFKNVFNIGYSIEGVSTQYLKGDTKLLLSVMKTVSVLVGNFIRNHPNDLFLIFAESKTGVGLEDVQKLELYRQIISQNLPKGFRMGNVEVDLITKGIFICRNI